MREVPSGFGSIHRAGLSVLYLDILTGQVT